MIVYICGPMSGVLEYNFPAFNREADRIRRMGHTVFNPAENNGGDPNHPEGRSWYMREAIKMLVKCDTIVVLRGWRESKGACLEFAIACELGMPVYEAETFGAPMPAQWHVKDAAAAYEMNYGYTSTQPTLRAGAVEVEVTITHNDRPENETILQEAQRLVHGERNADYGHPLDDFTKTGRIWGAILGLPDIPAEKVGLCMAGVKISREVNKQRRDNLVDLVGYAETIDMCITERAGREGK